ncbi:MAG: hypothetical protein KI790_04100 [Cyclobacteriaceae bacterium]|nr:hypothetical protein [Cyclobacteriaceae bacterium HetDA_MAG_MS6]
MCKSNFLIHLLVSSLFLLSCNPDQQKAEATESNKVEASNTPKFDYVAPLPQNGLKKGVVLLGSAGFDAFVVEADDQKRWKMVDAQYGVSKVFENQADLEAVQAGLEDYIASMENKGVDGKNIHFIVSSSARENEKVALINQALANIGYNVNTVNAEQEGQYALKASLPKEFHNEAFMVDIGSGNTKISWIDGEEIKTIETYGAKYYKEEIQDTKVFNEVKELAQQIPATKRSRCFLIGGAPYLLAKSSDEYSERYSVLKSPKDYQLDDPKAMAGANILAGLQAGASVQDFIFDWESSFSIGFILSL